ncbi:macrolide family glycosyltransferase [Nonomuraea sp. NPDC048901]|uniref:macrolide family glycosyltransferase n=1 Tax=Nonomuraea sp. NPDC048901 TaxID=3155627 RepID=UPI0033E03CD1
MATAAFLAFPGYGHIIPSLPVVAELVRRGEVVHYFALDYFRPAIEATGAVFHTYGDDMPLEGLGGDGNPLRQINAFLSLGRWVLEHTLKEVRALEPDYIVYDILSTWGGHMASILGVPAACSVPILLVNRRMAYALPLEVLRIFACRVANPGQVVRNRMLARSIRRDYGVDQPHDFRVFTNPGPLNIVYSSRMFQPYAAALPEDRFVFVGPALQARPEFSFPTDWLDGRPLVYVSLGTVFNDRPEFYRTCIEAFGDQDLQVVISAGRSIASWDLGAIPDNIRVEAFVPQVELLRHASLFITHGGTNSVYEALSFGVPMVVIPQDADQPWMARRVARLGAGRVLTNRRLDARSLRRAAAAVMARPSYAEAAATVGASLHEAGGAPRAADEIQRRLRPMRLTAR